MWTTYYTYANLSTLASSCEVHRRPWSIGDLDRRRSRLSTAPSCEVDDDLATHTRQYTLTLKCMLRGSKEYAIVRETTSWSEFQMFSSAALVITARLRMLHIPSCTYCAVASHHRAQCSSSLKHMRNNLIAHFLVAGSILLPAHVEKLEFFYCTLIILPNKIRQPNDPNT